MNNNYEINMEKATSFEIKPALKFWNPGADFKGVIECIGDIRHITKTEKMKNDMDVVDVRIIEGTETVEVTGENKIVKNETVNYSNEERTMTLTKSVLKTVFTGTNLQPLHSKKFLVVGRGKKDGKSFKYDDYLILEESEAIKAGILTPKA